MYLLKKIPLSKKIILKTPFKRINFQNKYSVKIKNESNNETNKNVKYW
jgi:hypothetical protein